MALGYLIKVMKNGKTIAHKQVGPEINEINLSGLLVAPGEYTATVTALGDGLRWRDSIESEESEPKVV